jgi:hypothetical protein
MLGQRSESANMEYLESNFTSLNNTTKPSRYVPHIATLPNEAISSLTPYSGLLLTLWLVILFTIKNWILEPFIFPRCYPKVLGRLKENDQLGFLVHHISAGVKIVVLSIGMKPFSNVVFGNSTLHDSYSGGHGRPTMGDMLLVLGQLFVALYVFELLVRKKVSVITSLHHISAIVIGQTAVALSVDLENQANATMEFILCFVWAAFDALFELWLNLAFIIYRIYPERHGLMAKVFGCTMMLIICGALTETVIIMMLFGGSWAKWEMSFKVLTPILHFLFTLAQLHGARILYSLWRREKKRLHEELKPSLDFEGGSRDSQTTAGGGQSSTDGLEDSFRKRENPDQSTKIRVNPA